MTTFSQPIAVSQNPPLRHLGFVQFEVQLGCPEDNLASLIEALQRLQPPPNTLLLLPELWGTGFAYRHLAELLPVVGTLLNELQCLARRYRLLLAGSLPEAGVDHGRYFNTLSVVGEEGVIGSYRKTYPFPGEEIAFDGNLAPPRPVPTPLANFGCMVCYDLRFPDIARQQMMQGADYLLCSAQWPEARLSHLHALAMARAIENQTYLVACNAVGNNGAISLGGGSLIVAPDGQVVARGGDRPQAEVVEVRRQLLEQARGSFRSFPVASLPAMVEDKLVDADKCLALLAARRRAGQRLISLRWHGAAIPEVLPVEALQAARRSGDFLVVGVDAAIADDQRRLLAALACVDLVVAVDGMDGVQQRILQDLCREEVLTIPAR